ncbi:Uncharacterised protein [Vibrio cholerae]|nr:Uncharacterised protein [Vibrio cholerae]
MSCRLEISLMLFFGVTLPIACQGPGIGFSIEMMSIEDS